MHSGIWSHRSASSWDLGAPTLVVHNIDGRVPNTREEKVMKAKTTLSVLCATALLSTSLSSPALAQGETHEAIQPWMYGSVKPRGAGTAEACPGLLWDLARTPTAQNGSYTVRGPIWNADGSGISMATGELRSDRTFTLNVNSVNGKGVEGQITGRVRPDGARDIKMTGSGSCSNLELHLPRGQTSIGKR